MLDRLTRILEWQQDFTFKAWFGCSFDEFVSEAEERELNKAINQMPLLIMGAPVIMILRRLKILC